MSLPRLIPELAPPTVQEGTLITLGPDQARHLKALRLQPGDALELLLPAGAWKADLAELKREGATARLVAILDEDREPPVPLVACLPLTSHLGLWDEWLPPLVELGVTEIRPIAYTRSEYEARKTFTKLDRWRRLIHAACEQSHRSRIPVLLEPQPFEVLLSLDLPQKWVAYELATGAANPPLTRAGLAFTSGPEGGITEEEFTALRQAGWLPVSLGKSILRAVTTPVALMGAVQYALHR
jgi:16S rRNA (uracil1498-N3)-methyltransferase